MPELVIKLTDEQHLILTDFIRKQQKINIENETHSGFEFKLSSTDEGIACLDLRMHNDLDIGYVDWEIKQSDSC